jgi:hypothetical protein
VVNDGSLDRLAEAARKLDTRYRELAAAHDSRQPL